MGPAHAHILRRGAHFGPFLHLPSLWEAYSKCGKTPGDPNPVPTIEMLSRVSPWHTFYYAWRMVNA
mgnify:CR=1 FL=1